MQMGQVSPGVKTVRASARRDQACRLARRSLWWLRRSLARSQGVRTDGVTKWFARARNRTLRSVFRPTSVSRRRSVPLRIATWIQSKLAMILELTDAQATFQRRIERFAADRVRPEAAGIDERGEFPRALVGGLAGLGLVGVTV